MSLLKYIPMLLIGTALGIALGCVMGGLLLWIIDRFERKGK